MIKQTMNPVIKKKWVKALRSGEYEQGQNKLLERTNEGDKFCCLGVLCNIYAQEHPGTGFKEEKDGSLTWYFNETDVLLPKDVAKWADLDKDIRLYEVSEYDRKDTEDLLAYLNDDKEMNFNQIADWIDENL